MISVFYITKTSTAAISWHQAGHNRGGWSQICPYCTGDSNHMTCTDWHHWRNVYSHVGELTQWLSGKYLKNKGFSTKTSIIIPEISQVGLISKFLFSSSEISFHHITMCPIKTFFRWDRVPFSMIKTWNVWRCKQASQLHYLGHTNFLLNLGFLHRKHKFSLNLVWISTWKSQFYYFRYQFRAFGSRFEHFKVQKSLQGGPFNTFKKKWGDILIM
jgi:hypothetical protein